MSNKLKLKQNKPKKKGLTELERTQRASPGTKVIFKKARIKKSSIRWT